MPTDIPGTFKSRDHFVDFYIYGERQNPAYKIPRPTVPTLFYRGEIMTSKNKALVKALAFLAMTLIFSTCGGGNSLTGDHAEVGALTPIAAAWMYMSDDQNYNEIPGDWSNIDFKDVDFLYVGPAGIQDDGSFGLYQSSKTGDLANRFTWIMKTARAQNPSIKILISQWWGSGTGIWGSSLSSLSTTTDISNYASSVRKFLKSYLTADGGLDGFDIDYEDNNVTSNTYADPPGSAHGVDSA